MLRIRTLANFVSWTRRVSIVHRMLAIIPFTILIGCSEDGGGSPVTSNLSTPMDATGGPSPDLAPGSINADGTLLRFDSPDDDSMVVVTSTPTGAAVRLNWEHSSDANIFGYSVYYGKQPAQESGLCSSYEANQAVDVPPVTITRLEYNTLYFFAIKKFNEPENSCSNEVMVLTPPAQVQKTELSRKPLINYHGASLKS